MMVAASAHAVRVQRRHITCYVGGALTAALSREQVKGMQFVGQSQVGIDLRRVRQRGACLFAVSGVQGHAAPFAPV